MSEKYVFEKSSKIACPKCGGTDGIDVLMPATAYAKVLKVENGIVMCGPIYWDPVDNAKWKFQHFKISTNGTVECSHRWEVPEFVKESLEFE